MVVFWIFLGIIFFNIIFFLLICLSSLKIEILDLTLNSNKESKINNYLIYIKLKLLNKLTWLKLTINKNKVKKIRNSKLFNKVFLTKFLEKQIKIKIKDVIKNIKEINIEIEKLNMRLKIGLIDYIVTSIFVVVIASLISILLLKKASNTNKENYKYLITPLYSSIEPIINIKLNCIISIKMVHIIYTIYKLIKKRSVKYDERTSNRRTYECNHEKYSRYG